MLCQECDKREGCVRLCSKAEAYVNQDYTAQAHLLPATPISEPAPYPNKIVSVTRDEIILRMFFFERKTHQQIADKIDISRPAVTQRIGKYKRLIAKYIVETLTSIHR